MSSRTASTAGGGEGAHHRQRVVAARGGLPRPSRPPVPGGPGPRPGTPRPGGSSGAGWASGRAECNWWGGGRQQQAAAAAAAARRKPGCRGGRAAARVPTGKGNRELVRRALSPPAARGVLRRWSFRPAPSRLRNASSPSPASPRTRPS